MTIFITVLKRILKQPVNILLIALFPAITLILVSAVGNDDSIEGADVLAEMRFGAVDQDGTVLSRALVSGLGMRYNILELSQEDIAPALTDAYVPWVLLIREGYERDVLSGKAPELEGYSLTVSDVSALGSVSAQNISRALVLLGTNDPQVLAAWEESARIDIKFFKGESWESLTFWLGFYGFFSLFTAYFVVKTISDDKIKGMPDRLGVLPQRPRKILAQGTLAAFALTEFSAVLLLLVLHMLVSAIPNVMYLFALFSLYNLFSVGFVLAVLSALRSVTTASVVMTMFATLSSMLGGLFWPIHLVPDFMRRLAWFSPGYWLAQGLENVRDITFEGFGLSILFLAGFTAVALLLGGWRKIQRVEE